MSKNTEHRNFKHNTFTKMEQKVLVVRYSTWLCAALLLVWYYSYYSFLLYFLLLVARLATTLVLVESMTIFDDFHRGWTD